MHMKLSVATGLISQVILLVLLLPAPAAAVSQATLMHERTVKRAVALYYPTRFKGAHEWVLAQMQVESSGNCRAISPVGARGCLQIMPATWRELQGQVRLAGGVFNAKANIIQGVRYMAQQLTFWISPRSWLCQYELALACYNAGRGNIHKAQKLSGLARCWDTIKQYLPQVTGRHAKETIDYVTRIKREVRRLQHRRRI